MILPKTVLSGNGTTFTIQREMELVAAHRSSNLHIIILMKRPTTGNESMMQTKSESINESVISNSINDSFKDSFKHNSFNSFSDSFNSFSDSFTIHSQTYACDNIAVRFALIALQFSIIQWYNFELFKLSSE